MKLLNKRYNVQFKRQTGNRFRKMDEKPRFSGTKNALVQRIYLADGAAAQLEVLLCDDIQQRSAVFFEILHPDPSKHVFLLLSVSLGCFLLSGMVLFGDPFL